MPIYRSTLRGRSFGRTKKPNQNPAAGGRPRSCHQRPRRPQPQARLTPAQLHKRPLIPLASLTLLPSPSPPPSKTPPNPPNRPLNARTHPTNPTEHQFMFLSSHLRTTPRATATAPRSLDYPFGWPQSPRASAARSIDPQEPELLERPQPAASAARGSPWRRAKPTKPNVATNRGQRRGRGGQTKPFPFKSPRGFQKHLTACLRKNKTPEYEHRLPPSSPVSSPSSASLVRLLPPSLFPSSGRLRRRRRRRACCLPARVAAAASSGGAEFGCRSC